MSKVTLLFPLLIVFALGCAQSTIKPENASADYGSPPATYQERIKTHWKASLKDPNSLQIKEIGAPAKAIVYSATEAPHGYDLYSDVTFTPAYGYTVCATYNAKNSYGGYVGWKTETYFFDSTGKMSVPIAMSKEAMSGMHRTGTFLPETRIITMNPCPTN